MEDAISAVGAAQVNSQVGVTVLRKAMDAQEQEGAALIEMIKAAAQGVGGDEGGGLDVYA
jgi:hypothetical protein